jgi:surfeit locus 1 family protein
MFAEFERRGSALQVDLDQPDIDDRRILPGYRASATGRYRGATILLDNQVHRGRVGYLVYTAFELSNRTESVLINRGWISAGTDRGRAPKLATPTVGHPLEGRLSPPPQGGLRLDGDDMIEVLADDILRVQTIDFADLAATLDVELLPITVLLDSEAPYGFVRNWTPPGSDESRHLGYAFQWFALAVTVVVVTLVLTIRSRKAGTPP